MQKLKIFAAAASFGLSVAVSPLPAIAQSIELGPGGVRINPYDAPGIRGGRQFDMISPREARSIARDEGLVEIDAVIRTGNRYHVEGVDRRGRDVQVIIDARSGDVIRVVREGG